MDEKHGRTEANEAQIKIVQDIARTLTKTVRTFNTYPKGNPIYQKFTTELFEKFSLFFESGDKLQIDIRQYSLLYKETEVYFSEERTDNIAMLLFSDGLRQITFHKGITSDEITDFIDILRLAPKAEASDMDDIVTLLWEKNIRNMSYVAVDDIVDDNLVVDEWLLRKDLDQALSPKASAVSDADELSSEVSVEPLTEGEIDALTEELSEINEESLLSSVVDLLIGLLMQKEEADAFPEIVQSIGRILDIRMQRKDLRGAIEILRRLTGILEACETSLQREMITRAVSAAGSIEHLNILFQISSDGEEISQYLLLLGTRSLPQMLQVLGELQDRKQRRLLCDILAEIGRQDINVLAEFLNDDRWYLVRNIVIILGMTKDPAAVSHLEMALQHTDLRVRRETIRALEGIAAGETKKLFLVALEDSDVAVRIAAIRALRRLKAPGLFEVFREYISRHNLREKPFAEKQELLETIAVLGGQKAFPLLSGLFAKKGLIEREDITEIRAAAACGLGYIKTQEARALLEKEKNAKKGILRDACIKALKEF